MGELTTEDTGITEKTFHAVPKQCLALRSVIPVSSVVQFLVGALDMADFGRIADGPARPRRATANGTNNPLHRRTMRSMTDKLTLISEKPSPQVVAASGADSYDSNDSSFSILGGWSGWDLFCGVSRPNPTRDRIGLPVGIVEAFLFI